MGKRANKSVETVVESTVVVETPKTGLEDLTREELHARRIANVAERARLAEENILLAQLWKNATSGAKKSNAEAKIAALQAKLAALTNPTVAEDITPVVEGDTVTELAM